MEAFTRPAKASPPEPPKKPRKWFRFILLLAVVLFLLGLAVGAALLACISAARKSSPPYELSLKRVLADPQVIEQLGQPIRDTTWLPPVNTDSGRTSLDFDVGGPNGTAHVRAEARMIDGQWGLISVEVAVEDGQRLRLELDSDEGLSDAPAWSANAKEAGPTEHSDAQPPPTNVEPDLPAGLEIQLPDIPKSPQ